MALTWVGQGKLFAALPAPRLEACVCSTTCTVGLRAKQIEKSTRGGVFRRWDVLRRLRVERALYGGEGGIRTHGRVTPTTVFETVRFGHSRTSPALAGQGGQLNLPARRFQIKSCVWPRIELDIREASLLRKR